MYNISKINQMAASAPKELILQGEAYYESQLVSIAQTIESEPIRPRVVLLAGPSASGKTTTARKLEAALKNCHIGARTVSLDDFFKGNGHYPILPDGTEDYESILGLDLELLRECLKNILDSGTARFPKFDFTCSTRCAEMEEICLQEGEVLIVEGIHALNPMILEGIESQRIFQLYVSAAQGFGEGGQELLSVRKLRLIRRMVRDARFRAHPADKTLDRWELVLAGEEKYIFPYKDRADIQIDSTLIYEPCIAMYYLSGLLHQFTQDSHAVQMGEILTLLSRFETISPVFVPEDSLYREFIGSGGSPL